MDQDWDTTNEFQDNFNFINDWLNQDIDKKQAAPNVPSISVYSDPGDEGYWETNNSNVSALGGGTAVTKLQPQNLQIPQTPAHASHGSLSPFWENTSTEFEFGSPSIQQTWHDDTVGLTASPNPSMAGNLPVHLSGNSSMTDGFSFSPCATAVQVPSEVDDKLGLTYKILSPVVGAPNHSAPVVDGIYNIGAVAPSSEVQVKLESVIEPSTQKSDKNGVDNQKSSKRSSVGRPSQSRKRPSQHKVKLHEINVPYPDEEKEKKRQNAIKARRNREKLAKEKKELSDEVAKLRRIVQERDATIEFLKQQRQLDRSRAVEFHRSELRRLEAEGQV